MEAATWDQGEEVAEGDFSTTSAIAEETPRALSLPTTTRYRCFTDELAETQSLQRCRYGSSFVVHKRRRQEMLVGAETLEADSSAVVRIPHRRRTPFDVAQRRLETFHWLAQARSADDIQSRFALDRRTGAAPNLASLRRAVRWLCEASERSDPKDQYRRGAHAAIIDLLEELVLDGSPHLSPALCLDIVAALADNPMPVARLLIARHACPPATVPSVAPAAPSSLRTVWGPLCAALASVALADTAQAPARLKPGFLGVFSRVVQLTREAGDLTVVHAAAYGRCLLAVSGDAVHRVRLINLVRQDILNASVLAQPPIEGVHESAALVVGAFLSDVVCALCEPEEESAAVVGDTAPHAAQQAEALSLSCEVVHYAALRRLPMTSRSVETLIVTAATAQCTAAKVLALFALMCVVSTPTSEALRVSLPYAFDSDDSGAPSAASAAVLPSGDPLEFFMWCVRRFAGLLLPATQQGDAHVRQIGVVAYLGKVLCTGASAAGRATAAWWSRRLAYATELLVAVSRAPTSDGSAVSPMALTLLDTIMPFLLSAVAAIHGLSASSDMYGLSVEAQRALLGDIAADGVFAPYWAAARGSGQKTAAPALPALLQAGIASECSCNVLDAAACNMLAAHPPHEAAFVKMMDGYVRKKGALALLPFQTLASPTSTTDGARAMLRRWQRTHSEWFVCVPLALSLTLGEHESLFGASCELLRVIQHNGHKRAAIMTGDETLATQAKTAGVQATIFLGALLTRLGAQ